MDIYTLKTRHAEEAFQEMEELASSEARVFLLYCNRQEATYIMRAANSLGLTGKNYIWIVTQSVVGPAFDNTPPPADFPTGLLGNIPYFKTSVCVFVFSCLTALDSP